MPATRPASAKKPSTKRATTRHTHAITLLEADHKQVKKLFKAYDKLAQSDASDDEKLAVAQDICNALTVHATIEEELLYPAARRALDEEDLLDEAAVEHASAKDLIAQIEAMEPSDPLYDAKVKVLGEYIDHHVKEEEGEMFPKLRKADLDLDELGDSLRQRKDALMAGVADAPVH